MDRRSLIKNAGMAGVLAAGAAPAIVHASHTCVFNEGTTIHID